MFSKGQKQKNRMVESHFVISSHSISSNTISAIIYVNGQYYDSAITSINNYNETLQFGGLPKGAQVFFYISVGATDGFNFKFYD